MTQSASTSNSQSLSNQDASQHRTPAVVNKVTTHTPSVIRSTSADRSSTNGSAANSTSNAANTQSAENRSARANYGTHDEVPLVTGKQLRLFIDESFEEHRPDPRMMHMGIAAILPEGDAESLAGFRNALYP